MLRSVVVSVLLSAAVACASRGEGDPTAKEDRPVEASRRFKVVLADNMPVDYRDQVVRAVSAWSEATAGRWQGDVEVVPRGEVRYRRDGEIVVLPVTNEVGTDFGRTETEPGEDGRPSYATMWLRVTETREEARYATALHELGHALGLHHDSVPSHESVMWPVVTVPGRISCWDRRAACEVWGCPLPECSDVER